MNGPLTKFGILWQKTDSGAKTQMFWPRPGKVVQTKKYPFHKKCQSYSKFFIVFLEEKKRFSGKRKNGRFWVIPDQICCHCWWFFYGPNSPNKFCWRRSKNKGFQHERDVSLVPWHKGTKSFTSSPKKWIFGPKTAKVCPKLALFTKYWHFWPMPDQITM